MCIYVPRNNKVLIANKPITVYKIFDTSYPFANTLTGKLLSPYQETLYKIGVLKTAKQDFKKTEKIFQKEKEKFLFQDFIELSYGIHSYRTKTRAIEESGTYRHLFLCKLPIGTRYIRGCSEHSEIVSNQLIVVKHLKND